MEVSRISLANQHVSIVAVCRLIGMSIPDISQTKSVKVHCPFGMVHPDQGYEASFRIYPDSNSAYCFSTCGYFSPVWLYAQARDMSNERAAEALLASVGYEPESLDDRWEAAARATKRISEPQLAQALQIYLARVDPQWEILQFDPKVSAKLIHYLDLLPRVKTEEDVNTWMEAAKLGMTTTLREAHEASIPGH